MIEGIIYLVSIFVMFIMSRHYFKTMDKKKNLSFNYWTNETMLLMLVVSLIPVINTVVIGIMLMLMIGSKMKPWLSKNRSNETRI